MAMNQSIWSIIQVFGKQGVTLITFFILALILNPADFGLLGMAMTFILFIMVFSELGFGSTIIQKKDIGNKHISTIFVMNVIMGIALTALGIGCAPLAALFYKAPTIKPVLIILSFGFLINSFSLTQLALAQKEMKFKKLAIRDVSSALIGGAVGIVLAFNGYGVWSLVWQTLLTYLVSAILLWKMSEWRPDLRLYNFSLLKEVWPYSSQIFYFGVLKYFVQNSDKLLIGFYLGPNALGIYMFSSKMVISPTSLFAGAIGNYMFPRFSKMQDDLRGIARDFIFFNKATNLILLPYLLAWILASKEILEKIFGEKWLGAITLSKYLAIVGVIQIFYSPIGQLMKALNKPNWLFKWSLFMAAITIICIYFGASGSITTVGISLLAANILGLPFVIIILKKLIQFNHLDYKQMYITHFFVSGVLIVAINLLKSIKSLDSMYIIVSLVIVGYFAIFCLMEKDFCMMLVRKVVK